MEARGGAVLWGTALQAEILPSARWLWGRLGLLTEMSKAAGG